MSAPPIRAAVVDDEELARERLRRLLEREPDVEIVADCATGREAVAEILSTRPDVVFLDVKMPGLDGFGVLRSLRAAAAEGDPSGALPLVVFVTAFDEHALRAFEVHAADYVLKPIDPDRFREVVARLRTRHREADVSRRYRELLRLIDQVEGPSRPAGPAGEVAEATLQRGESRAADRLLVKEREKLYLVRAADIDWIEASGNYVRLHVGARAHLVRDTMARLEESLDPGTFARIHRSTIVNLDRVREMEPWFSGEYLVTLTTGTQLRMSRWYRDRVLGRFGRAPAEESAGPGGGG